MYCEQKLGAFLPAPRDLVQLTAINKWVVEQENGIPKNSLEGEKQEKNNLTKFYVRNSVLPSHFQLKLSQKLSK